VRTIELAGAVGAGKTSLAEPLRELLSARGHEVLTLAEARRRIATGGIGRGTSRVAAARFIARHPGLVLHAARSLLTAPIAGWHRRHILMLVLRLGAELDLLEARLPPATWVILDEGWLHRSVSLFAWRVPVPGRDEIARYLDRAPLSRIIVLVEAPEEILRARVTDRGLPKRLRGRSAPEAEAFMVRTERVLHQAASSLADDPRGVRLLRVTNDGPQDDLPRRLARAIDAAPGPAPARPHVQHWPSLVRPDRLVARMVARRRSETLRGAIVRAAVDGFGLPEPVQIEPSPSPGGRGTVLVLRDAVGDAWLLKRYKESLGDRDIAVEHAVLQRLAAIRFRAPRLRRGASGATVVHVEGARVALFELVGGHVHPHERLFSPVDRRRLEAQAGATLGGLHAALCGFEPPAASENGFVSLTGPRVRPVAWFSDRLAVLAGAAGRRGALDEAAGWIAAELDRLDGLLEGAAPTRTVVHGDYGPYNLLLRTGRAPFVIDFELARIDWRLTDLATAIPRFAQRRIGFERPAAVRFLDGYRARTAIDEAELALLPAVAEYLALRRAVVCWDRHASSSEQKWLDQARERLAFARRLASGRHPLISLVGG